ncbi:MAG: hypothetical protein IPJ82_23805 [Lewinellaceae bacterium]|nr:hypothetical protein [Lewinellaceae bacterium]
MARLYREWSFKCVAAGLADSALTLAERSIKLMPGDVESQKTIALAQLAKISGTRKPDGHFESATDAVYFASALAGFLYLSVSNDEQETLLRDFQKLKNQRVVLPETENILRLLLFDRIDSNTTTLYGISLPPFSIKERDLLPGFHDTTLLFVPLRNCTIFPIRKTAPQP